MVSISLTELEKVTYLKADTLNGRIVNLLPFWDEKEWHIWTPSEKGLLHIKPLDAAKSAYISKAPAKQGDLYIPFVDLMWQRASYPNITHLISGICADFYNISISLEKLRHIFDTRNLIKSNNAGGFAATEIEYILTITRSIFDSLYEILHCFWNEHTRLVDIDAERNRRSKKWPKKLSKFLLNDGKPRSANELRQHFGIPMQLAQEFANYGPFFASLRYARDKIIHGGASLDSIFVTERGFCVSPTTHPFSSFYQSIDCTPYKFNDAIVSVLPWLAKTIFGTIDACNSLTHVFGSIVLLPPEIAPGFKIFIRDPSGHALIDAHTVYKGEEIWWNLNLEKA